MTFNTWQDYREWDKLAARVALRSLEKVVINVE